MRPNDNNNSNDDDNSWKPSINAALTILAAFSSCDLDLCLVTLTFKCDPDSVKVNQCARYLGRRSFSSRVIVRIYRLIFGPRLPWHMTLTFSPRRATAMTTHTQKFKFKVSRFKRWSGNKRTDRWTDGRCVAADCFSFPANAVGK